MTIEMTIYTSPQVEILEMEIEKGFAESNPIITNPDMEWED